MAADTAARAIKRLAKEQQKYWSKVEHGHVVQPDEDNMLVWDLYMYGPVCVILPYNSWNRYANHTS